MKNRVDTIWVTMRVFQPNGDCDMHTSVFYREQIHRMLNDDGSLGQFLLPLVPADASPEDPIPHLREAAKTISLVPGSTRIERYQVEPAHEAAYHPEHVLQREVAALRAKVLAAYEALGKASPCRDGIMMGYNAAFDILKSALPGEPL